MMITTKHPVVNEIDNDSEKIIELDNTLKTIKTKIKFLT